MSETQTVLEQTTITNDTAVPIFEKCITCNDIEHSCNGPNMLTMDIAQLRVWVKRRKRQIGMSVQDLSDRSGVPKSTLDRFLSGAELDFKYSTVHAICLPLVGLPSGHPCPASSADLQRSADAHAARVAELEGKITALQKQLDESDTRHDAIHAATRKDLEESIRFLHTILDQKDAELDFHRKRGRVKNILIGMLAGVIVILAILVTLYFIWDLANGNFGIVRF